jgi:hypothetical protein
LLYFGTICQVWARLRGVEKKLNAMLATHAGANRAEYVDARAASIGRDACQILPLGRARAPGVAGRPRPPQPVGHAGYAAAGARRLNVRA